MRAGEDRAGASHGVDPVGGARDDADGGQPPFADQERDDAEADNSLGHVQELRRSIRVEIAGSTQKSQAAIAPSAHNASPR